MSTRSKSDKNEIEDLYKSAIEGHRKSKPSIPGTLHTSTPIATSKSISKPLTYPIYDSEVEGKLPETSSESLDSSSDFDSCDITVQSKNETIKFATSNKDICDITLETMAHHNPFATLKYAVEAVPFFDGKNIPLNYFIEGCEEAKSMLPNEAESQFTRVIRTKIVGEARRTIQDQDFNSVAQLTRYLKQIYGPSKNVYQLQGELGCVYQKTEEDVVTYANRVKILGKQILEAYRNSGNLQPDQNIKASLEKDMCKCFIRGLKPELEQRIARELDVQGTVADALRLERELHAMTDLRQGTSSGQNLTPTNRVQETCQICYKNGHLASNCRKLAQFSQQTQNRPDLGTEILVCQICKKRGHSADKCRLRDPRSRQPVNVVQENVITCQICFKTGHNAKSCRSNNNSGNSNNNSTNRNSLVCQWCEKIGHSASNCWKRQNNQYNTENTKKTACQICNNFGHTAKDCRSNLAQQTSPKNNLFCRYCKENGHLLENCELRIASNNRRKENNQGNSNGPLKTGVQQGSAKTAHPTTS